VQKFAGTAEISTEVAAYYFSYAHPVDWMLLNWHNRVGS